MTIGQIFRSFRRFLSRFRVSAAAKREQLDAEIAKTEQRIMKRAKANSRGAWLDAANAALAQSKVEAERGRFDAAWRYLHEARRQEIFDFAPAELLAGARTLKNEAALKLDGWRKLTVEELVAPVLAEADSFFTRPPVMPPKSADAFLAARRCCLAAAMEVRDEHASNQYFKLRLVQKQVTLLLWMFLVFLVLFVTVIGWAEFVGEGTASSPVPATGNAPPLDKPTKLDRWELVSGMLAGALGACFSGLASLVSSAPDQSIPERIASSSVTVARPVIGAASALAAMLLLSGGLLGNMAEEAMLAVAFAFGFSERLAIGALGKAGPR